MKLYLAVGVQEDEDLAPGRGRPRVLAPDEALPPLVAEQPHLVQAPHPGLQPRPQPGVLAQVAGVKLSTNLRDMSQCPKKAPN